MADGGWLSFTDVMTRCRSMAVCHRWRAHACDQELWTTFELHGGGELIIDDKSLDRLIGLAGGRMVSLSLDGLPRITADGLKRLRENTLLSYVSITNCIGEWTFSSSNLVRTPGITGRIADCLPPSVRVLHLVGCNVHAVADLPRLTARSWELDIYECQSCAYVAHLPSQRRCSRCTVVRCGLRHNDIHFEWQNGCADSIACDTCDALFCSECMPAMSRCQILTAAQPRLPCIVARCATCVAEHGPPTLVVCGACEELGCEDCLVCRCDFCDDWLCTLCEINHMEICPRCESRYCSGCLDAANVSICECRSCKSRLCSNCDLMEYSCTRCERYFHTENDYEDYCRGCAPSCAGCDVMLCGDCGRHCAGNGCDKYYCDDCVPAMRYGKYEEEAPVRWAAMERLDLPRPKRCMECEDMFCPDCWDCPTLMPKCAACNLEMCNACAKREEDDCADADVCDTSCPDCGAYICMRCPLDGCKDCFEQD